MGIMVGELCPAVTSRRYWFEQKNQAVRMVLALGEELGATAGTVTRVPGQLGCGVESVREWVAQAEVDAGARARVTSAESLELKGLRQQNRGLRRANDIVWLAASFFACGARLSTAVTMRFIDQNRDEFRG